MCLSAILAVAVMNPWLIGASLFLSGTVICILLWVNWGRPVLRRHRLRKPVTAWFSTGPDRNEIHVPANNNDVVIQIHYEPKLDYVETAFQFGFEGDADKRPLPMAMRNEWIKQGLRREESPDTNPDHIINAKDRYEVRRTRPRTTDNEYTLGFSVKTRAPGRYKVILYIFAEEREGLPDRDLYVVVE